MKRLHNILLILISSYTMQLHDLLACDHKMHVDEMIREISDVHRSKPKNLFHEYVEIIMSKTNFDQSAKQTIGIGYRQFNDQEKIDFLDRYRVLASHNLAKLILPIPFNRVILGNPKISRINDHKQIVNIILTIPERKNTPIDIGFIVDDINGKCKIVNIVIDNIDLTVAYKAKFESFIESYGQKKLLDHMESEIKKIKK